MTEHVLFDTGCVNDFRIKIDKRFTVWKIKWRISVHLSPNKHVFRGKRNLLISVPYVGANCIHDLVFGKIDLWIQIGHAELATPPTAGRHLHNAKSRSRVGK